MSYYDSDSDASSRLDMDESYNYESEGESTYEARPHASKKDRYTAHMGPKGEVPYLSKESRKACRVSFYRNNNNHVRGRTQASGTINKHYPWAVVLDIKPGKEPKLYAAPKGNVTVDGSGINLKIEYNENARYFINHSAFRKGKSVSSAGIMQWNPDQQRHIVWNASGHYQPTPEHAAILGRFLAANGVRFSMHDLQGNFMFDEQAFR